MSAFGRVAARVAAAALFVAASAPLAIGDSDRWFNSRSHSDRVTPGAGNAAAANIATQTVDPWPAHSARKHINLDGKRAQKAIKRYETNTSITPRGVDTLQLNRSPTSDPAANGK